MGVKWRMYYRVGCTVRALRKKRVASATVAAAFVFTTASMWRAFVFIHAAAHYLSITVLQRKQGRLNKQSHEVEE